MAKPAVSGFIQKTYDIFHNTEYDDICGWNDKGDTIVIKDAQKFAEIVLRKYFKHQNVPSFTRSLNMYGFHKLVFDPEVKEFQHEFFLRNREDLLPKIKRKAHSEDKNKKIREHREYSDTILTELAELRKRNEVLEARVSKMEGQQDIARIENERLWTHLQSSKEKQALMQRKLHKLLMFMYQMYVRSTRSSQIQDAATNFTNDGSLSIQEFKDTLNYLCMDDVCPPVSNGSRKRRKLTPPEASESKSSRFQEIANEPAIQFETKDDVVDTTLVNEPDAPQAQFSTGSSSAPILETDAKPTPLGSVLADESETLEFTGGKESVVADEKPLNLELLSDEELAKAISNETLNLSDGDDQCMQKLGDFETDLFDNYSDEDMSILLQECS